MPAADVKDMVLAVFSDMQIDNSKNDYLNIRILGRLRFLVLTKLVFEWLNCIDCGKDVE